MKKVFSVKLNKKLQKFIFFYYICGVRILHLITIRLYAEGFQPIVSAYSVETFLYFVNNLKTVGCYCGVCRRCGFCLREFMVPKTEGRMSDRPPLAVRRTDMKHLQLQRSSSGISLEYAGILYIETLKPGKHANRNSATPSVS
ncbi:MAG: hypothetical protein ACLUHB_16540, partial [Odoribacter splanchnicus]